jgi:hypothetical protein
MLVAAALAVASSSLRGGAAFRSSGVILAARRTTRPAVRFAAAATLVGHPMPTSLLPLSSSSLSLLLSSLSSSFTPSCVRVCCRQSFATKSLSSLLLSLSLTFLLALLRQRSLAVSGTKAQLVERYNSAVESWFDDDGDGGNYHSKSKSDLRELLRQRGLAVSGTKAQP